MGEEVHTRAGFEAAAIVAAAVVEEHMQCIVAGMEEIAGLPAQWPNMGRPANTRMHCKLN